MLKSGSSANCNHIAHPRLPKARKKIYIVLGIAISLLLLAGTLFALNYNSIMLANGTAAVKVNGIYSIKDELEKDHDFQNISDHKDSNGTQTVTASTKNGDISVKVVQKNSNTVKKNAGSDKNEIITAHIDFGKLMLRLGVSKEKLLKGNVSAIKRLKTEVDKYLEPLVGKDQVTGLEIYIARRLYSQKKTKMNTVDFSHDFGGTLVKVTGILSEKKITVSICR